ncbi:MAG TPA: LysM peptidoglycan-binding domain-containing protein [Gaiellaceae bacterium]|nr:LysM peptidoglycan-binding domain-containing protein [Gaiellaceae bacterium]
MFARVLMLALLVAVVWAVAARASSAAGAERAYTVQPGDTLWSIAARRYGGDPRRGVWRIEQRNGLSGGTIRAGQTLVLP